MDDSIKDLKASDAVVNEKLRSTEVNVGRNLTAALKTGAVASVMVNEADRPGVEQRLRAASVKVFGNTKVPCGMAAIYDATDKMLGLYQLGT